MRRRGCSPGCWLRRSLTGRLRSGSGRGRTRGRGIRRGSLFTAEQWANFDALNAAFDGMEARYGRFAPRSMALMRASRGVW